MPQAPPTAEGSVSPRPSIIPHLREMAEGFFAANIYSGIDQDLRFHDLLIQFFLRLSPKVLLPVIPCDIAYLFQEKVGPRFPGMDPFRKPGLLPAAAIIFE